MPSERAPILIRLEALPRAHEGRPGIWTASCPAHTDAHPSFGWTLGTDGRVLLRCQAGCSAEDVVDALGSTMRDLFPPSSEGRRRVALDPNRKPQLIRIDPGKGEPTKAGLTLAELASAKHLSVEFLQTFGCADDRGPSVRIPYHDPDGNLTSTRSRLALIGDRFRWRKGDRPLLYGLWRLDRAREAGWVLLVEGETDCWTLWNHGIPALGIPGKATWRAEWACFLDGLEVCLWQEPDAEDLVARVARDLPNLKVIVATPETKDVSDAHIRGDDVAALIERLRAEATPSSALRDQRARERGLAAHEAATPVLQHPDPLELVEREMRAQGHGGDLQGPMLGYLAATSRLLAWRRGTILAHLLFMGPSSGGKNAAMQAALRLMPDEAVHRIDAGSPRVLIYDPEPLDHRVVVFSEADSLPSGEDNPAASAIRNLLQDGRLHYQVAIRDAATGGFTVHRVDKPGPTVLMTTSTRPLGHQLMTRLFTVEIPDEPTQLRAALAAQAAMELHDPPPANESLVAFQRYLGALAPIDVVVPFADSIQAALGEHPPGPRVLRDFPRLLSLVKAAAVVRIAYRTRDNRGRLVAEIDDYRVVHRLVADTYQASTGASQRIRDAVAAVDQLTGALPLAATVTVSEVATRLGISVSSAWRRVHAAVVGKWLVNDEHRRSQTAKLRLGEPLPMTSSLPTAEAIAEHFRLEAKKATPGDFTFSANPDGSHPPPDGRHLVGGGVPSVNAENVQTADMARQVSSPPPLNFGIFVDEEEEWGVGTA